MKRRLRYFALGLFLLVPCAARCDEDASLPTIDNAVLNVLSNTLFVTVRDMYGEERAIPLYGLSWPLVEDTNGNILSIADKFNQGLDLFGLFESRNFATILDIWQILEQFGAGVIDWSTDPPYFQRDWDKDIGDIFNNSDFIVACCKAFQKGGTSGASDILGRYPYEPAGSLALGDILLPTFGKAISNLANGNFSGGNGGGGNGGGGDQSIQIQIHGGVTNITRILTNHFDRATNYFNVVSNSLVTITNSVVIVTNQIEVALDYLKQIATNTQQDAIITILEFMTNNWPDVNISFPDHSNDVQDVTNKLRVGRYSFHASSGPLVVRDNYQTIYSDTGWRYKLRDDGRYALDSYESEVSELDQQIDNGSYDFGEVVTFCLQGILDKAQDIKNSLWILNHAFDTNSAPVDISELDSLKSEVDSFVHGTQGTLESAFYNVDLDDGIFTKFKNNFVSIFGTVGRGPPMLRGAKGASDRQTLWSFYVGDQRWDISLDSTLYTSSRRLCRMAASMVWCVLLWLAFRKILIRAVYWLVKCIDWCFQVFGFQIKLLGTIEEFLKQVAGIGPGG